MFPALTSMLPGLVSQLAPSLASGLFKGGSKTSSNSAQLKSLASQLLAQRQTASRPVSRPLPPRPAQLVQNRQVSQVEPEKKDDKTMIYVGIGAAALVGVILLTKK